MGIIYFATCGLTDGAIKIGYSDDPEKRIRQLGLPDVELIAIFPGDITQETELHRRFEHLRLGNSEWFRLDRKLRALITSLQRRYQITLTDDEPKKVSDLLISPSELIQLRTKDLISELQEKKILLLALKKRGRRRDSKVKEYNRPFAALIQWPPLPGIFETDGQLVQIFSEQSQDDVT